MADAATTGAALKRGYRRDELADLAGALSPRSDVVACTYGTGTKLYHYTVPGAVIGDTVLSPGAATSCKVVAVNADPALTCGAAKLLGNQRPCKTVRTATIHFDEEYTTMHKSSTVPSSAQATADAISHHEAEAKRLRKLAKKSAKRQRIVEAERAKRAAFHKLAIDTLAEIAAGSKYTSASRVKAAVALAKRVA